MVLGSDRLHEDIWLQKMRGKRVAIVTNSTGVNSEFINIIDQISEMQSITLSAIFGPEHGLYGVAQAGVAVEDSIDNKWGVPIYSLYGDNLKPSKSQLKDIDIILIELQDVGLRYYTYLYTMSFVLEAASDLGITVVVLDRPNPLNGIIVEGGILRQECSSFVGLHPIPIRHGLTIGELAILFNSYLPRPCDLTIVPLVGWLRDYDYNLIMNPWFPPSLNLPHYNSVLSYAGMCLFEGTNISEGRGTTKPFEWIGAPWIDGELVARTWKEKGIDGTIARPIQFSPTFSKYRGEVCSGVQIHILNSNHNHNLVSLGVKLLSIIKDHYPDDVNWVKYKDDRYFIDLLSGSQSLRKLVDEGEDVENLLAEWRGESFSFKEATKGIHLY